MTTVEKLFSSNVSVHVQYGVRNCPGGENVHTHHITESITVNQCKRYQNWVTLPMDSSIKNYDIEEFMPYQMQSVEHHRILTVGWL